MDWGRRGYRMDCRFFRDDEVVSRVRWYEADRDAEVLPFESVILSTQWEMDPWLPSEVGEVAGANRSTDLTTAPRGSGRGHVCGTEEDFAQGGEYLPDDPPVRYGRKGMPLCCGLWPLLIGGAGGGAHAGIVVQGSVQPGLTCETAGVIELDTWYEGDLPTDGFTLHWYRTDLLPLGFYRIEGDAHPSGTELNVSCGQNCVIGGPVSLPTAGGCVTYFVGGFCVAPTMLYVWIRRTFFGGPWHYRFRIRAGACE